MMEMMEVEAAVEVMRMYSLTRRSPDDVLKEIRTILEAIEEAKVLRIDPMNRLNIFTIHHQILYLFLLTISGDIYLWERRFRGG